RLKEHSYLKTDALSCISEYADHVPGDRELYAQGVGFRLHGELAFTQIQERFGVGLEQSQCSPVLPPSHFEFDALGEAAAVVHSAGIEEHPDGLDAIYDISARRTRFR